MHLFETATKKKLRFTTNRGNVTTEDLWDLPLEELDALARNLSKEVKDGEEVSFIEAKKPTMAFINLTQKFDIVKRVIEVKLADREAAENAMLTKARREKILAALEEKKNEGLKSMSEEELQKALEEL